MSEFSEKWEWQQEIILKAVIIAVRRLWRHFVKKPA